MRARKHVHKYHKVECFGQMLFFCALPDCNHHMPKHYEHGLFGKRSLCWNCGKEFLLDGRALKMDMPVCIECYIPPDQIDIHPIDQEHPDDF